MSKIALYSSLRSTMVAVMLLCLGLGAARAEDFLSVLDDMPLAPGLTELTDQAASFETPAGRIVDAAAQGAVAPQKVSSFYDRTLPALGWVREGAGRFIRDQERLTIVVAETAPKGQVVVRFSIRPRRGG
jgi:hypothetical protein